MKVEVKKSQRLSSSQIDKMIIGYRYMALVMTSITYLLRTPHSSWLFKVGIVVILAFMAVFMGYLYGDHKGNRGHVFSLLFIETLGNMFLILITGGKDSPYNWYAINTIFIAGSLLGIQYATINIMMYVTVFCYSLQRQGYMVSVKDLNDIVGFIFMGIMALLLIRYGKKSEEESSKLLKVNKQLEKTHAKVEDCVAYMMKIYETTHLLALQTDYKELVQIMLDCINDALYIDEVMFMALDEEEMPKMQLRNISEAYGKQLMIETMAKYKEIQEEKEYLELDLEGRHFISMPIQYTYKTFGYLIVECLDLSEELYFIVKLSSMVFEKLHLEAINKELLIGEEQNRIANEIHDSALQKLFGVNCKLYEVTRRIEQLKKEEVVTDINCCRESLANAMQEIRSVIYGLSLNKEGKHYFIDQLNTYINEMKGLYNAQINLEIEGIFEGIDSKKQTALYRILSEGISNALRHGKAKQMDIFLRIQDIKIYMTIKDNGCGFNLKNMGHEDFLGLGIKNMKYLVQTLNGTINIQSALQVGTFLEIEIPL